MFEQVPSPKVKINKGKKAKLKYVPFHNKYQATNNNYTLIRLGFN
jgi:hypothetical protein